MSITADQIVELFEADERARKRLAELLVTEPDVRLAIINAVLRDVATKGDLEEVRKELKAEIEKVRKELKEEIEGVREELKGDIERVREGLEREIRELKGEVSKLSDKVSDLANRVGKVESQLSLLIKVVFAINVSTLLGIIGLLIRGLAP